MLEFVVQFEKGILTLYNAAETDRVPTLLEFFEVHATRMASIPGYSVTVPGDSEEYVGGITMNLRQ
jgi:hypothetical protein